MKPGRGSQRATRKSIVRTMGLRENMVKKLTKHGNSLALVIDRPILDLLKIDTETPLELSTDGHRLIVAPAEQSERRQKFESAQRTAHKRYGKAFKKLAE
jgi:antitoxin component of MazEF toxin-antitoxin module